MLLSRPDSTAWGFLNPGFTLSLYLPALLKMKFERGSLGPWGSRTELLFEQIIVSSFNQVSIHAIGLRK